MQINVTINAATSPHELSALRALIDVLAGRTLIDALAGRTPEAHQPVPLSISKNLPLPTLAALATLAGLAETHLPQFTTTQELIADLEAPETNLEIGQTLSGDALVTDRDSAGLPWDARIHSENRALKADGTWRQRRNCDPALVAAVTAELLGEPQPTVTPVPPPPPPAPVAVSTELPVVAVVAAPSPPPPPPAQAAPTIKDFQALVRWANENGVAFDVMNATAQAAGLESFAMLTKNLDMVPVVADLLGFGQ